MFVFLLPLAFGLVQYDVEADHGKGASPQLIPALLSAVSTPADGFQVTPRLHSRAPHSSSSNAAGVLRAPPVVAAEPKLEAFDPLELSSRTEQDRLAGVQPADGAKRLAHAAAAAPLALAVAAPAWAKDEPKAEGINFDKILEEFFLLFPLIFTGGLVTFAAANFALKKFELEDRDDRMGEVMQFIPIAAAGGFAVLVYTQPGLILFPLKTASGFAMKTAFDVWNLVAPSIGLGGAILKY